MIVNKS